MHKNKFNMFTFISEFKKEEISNLDKKVCIILRDYKKNYNKDKILEIKQYCKKDKRKFFLANNLKLALNLNLDGAYIPSFNRNLCVQKYSLKKEFIILGSAHNVFEIRIKEKQKVDIIFLSPLFKTKQYKDGLGIIKFNNLSKLTKKKVVALGGIRKKNKNLLKITNTYGFSGISYFQSYLKNDK